MQHIAAGLAAPNQPINPTGALASPPCITVQRPGPATTPQIPRRLDPRRRPPSLSSSSTSQMVQFIKQEAKEKAAEIKLKADEEYNIQKLRAVEDEKQKIRGDYERKEKQVEVQKRIAQSNEVRLGRMKTLKAREEAMQAVLAEAAAKLPSLTQGSGYATLLESLILEALIELCDQKVQVKGIASAAAITQKAMTPAVAKYKEWATKSQGAAWASTIDVTFDSTPLTSGCARPPADARAPAPAPAPAAAHPPRLSLARRIGGVAVSGFGGKITLTNTLESRLMLAYETRLPELRRVLFA